MKIKKLILGFTLSLLVLSCSQDEATTDTSLDIAQTQKSAELDNITDDISAITENQIDIQSKELQTTNDTPQSFLPPCVTITVVIAENTWTRTIDFGTEGCTMPNGKVLKGKIIIAKSVDTNPLSRTYSITFDNFYVNARLIEGNKTIVRSLSTVAPIHPTSAMTMNITVTFPNGESFVRTGNRVSEMIEGFGTPIWNDNIFRVTGTWSTSRPNWSQTTTITSPLLFKMNCQYRLVQGTVQIVRNNNTASLDYGDGSCDNQATVNINGNVSTITFGS